MSPVFPQVLSKRWSPKGPRAYSLSLSMIPRRKEEPREISGIGSGIKQAWPKDWIAMRHVQKKGG